MIVKDLPQGCESCFCSHVDYFLEDDEYVLWCSALDECVTGNQYDRPNNCPLKSIDGLIERIRKMPNANPSYWNTCDVVDRDDLIDIIKEYCEVQVQVVDVTKDEECCCSCKHNIRKQDENGHINCHCDIDGHHIGYVANFGSVCKEWKDAYSN